MSLNIPETINDFIAANKRLDLDGMMKHFAPSAVMIDNGERHESVGEIRKLLEDAVAANAIFYPDAVHQEDGCCIVLEGPTEGDFPGSPLRFTYRLTIANGAIKTLETTAWS